MSFLGCRDSTGQMGEGAAPRLRSAGDPEVREFEPRALNWPRLVEFLREVGRLSEEGALAA